ncbi:MAG TPA: hypothetical protein PKX00_24435 [Opitutaceae bacterium]|jgi:hypothetical protein|nr:hypothetical protein [Opitutaceae bacterium]
MLYFYSNMPIQVNARLSDDDWERIVVAFPGVSNAERISQLVHQQLTLLDARRSLPDALGLIEKLLSPTLQTLREQGLRGAGSEVAELLAKTVAEMAALLLSHAEGLQRESARTLPELEHLLLQRWARTSIQILRTAAHDPGSLRHPAGSGLEARRVLDQAARLQPTALPAPVPPAPGA